MNVFSTEHPMVSQAPVFDARTYPFLNFVWNSLLITVVLVPAFIALYVYSVCKDAVEIGAEYDFPDSWACFTAKAFAFCFCFAVLLVAGYRLVEGYFRRKSSRS